MKKLLAVLFSFLFIAFGASFFLEKPIMVSGENLLASVGFINQSSNVSFSKKPRNISILLFQFQNDPNPPYTAEDVRKNFFEKNQGYGLTMSEFLSLSTYGRFLLTGKKSVDGSVDVYGWYTIPFDRDSDCARGGEQIRSDNIVSYVRNKAISDGLVVGPADILVVGTFENGCPGGGAANAISFNDGSDIVTMRGMSSDIWGNILHEFGHVAVGTSISIGAKGGSHSNSIKCQLQGLVVPWGTKDSTCTHNEYGSPFSVLGGYASGAQKNRLFDAHNRMLGGFLGESQYVTLSSTGLYPIKKINYADGQVLRIPFGAHKKYVNNKLIETINESFLEIEARDFYPFEQDADTYPHNDLLLLHINRNYTPGAGGFNQLITNENGKNFLAPNTKTTIQSLGVTIENTGTLPGDATKIGVRVEDGDPSRREKFQKINYQVNNRVVYINPVNGTFSKKPSLSGSTHQSEYLGGCLVHGSINTDLNNAGKRIFPVSNAVLPFDSLFESTTEIICEPQMNVTTPLDYQFSKDLLTEAESSIAGAASFILTAQPRSIYKITLKVTPYLMQNHAQYESIYIIHGEFSQLELMSLGVISSPSFINVSPVDISKLKDVLLEGSGIKKDTTRTFKSTLPINIR